MAKLSFEELCQGVAAELAARGFGASVIWQGKAYESTIALESEVELVREVLGDRVESPTTGGGNPRRLATRWAGGVALISSRATTIAAGEHRHDAATEELVDGVIASLARTAEKNKLGLEWGKAGFVGDESAGESRFGARYELHFLVSNTVFDKAATTKVVSFQGTAVAVIDGTEHPAATVIAP